MEDNNLAPDLQHGSHPGKTCLTPVLHKQVNYDLFRQSKQVGATLDNDASGAFDRIIQPLALLGVRRQSLSKPAALSLGLTWDTTHHVI